MSIIKTDNEFVASTYGRFPLELSEGMGAVAYDTEGKEYIDMSAFAATIPCILSVVRTSVRIRPILSSASAFAVRIASL